MLKAGPLTVRTAGVLLTVFVPSVADAVMLATPGFCPFTVAVATPVVEFIVTDSTVATFVLSELKVIVTPVIARPY